jgi:hypothetical protein
MRRRRAAARAAHAGPQRLVGLARDMQVVIVSERELVEY